MVQQRQGCGCERMQYQLYVQPDGEFEIKNAATSGGTTSGPNRYVPPTTDIRALEQTMYIPVIPTKPGGEREVTFPMTPRTLGQPDVTTSCCVPVLPCQPGFKNLTQEIKPNAADICKQGNFCGGGSNLTRRTCEAGGGLQCCQGGMTSAPRNAAGDAFVGVPDTFPPVNMRKDMPAAAASSGYGAPPPQTSGKVPGLYTEGSPAQLAPPRGDFSNNKEQPNLNQSNDTIKGCATFSEIKRNQDKKPQFYMEDPIERRERLTSMYGSHGSYLLVRPMPRRFISGEINNNVKQQGNGFHWDHPKNKNKACYMMGTPQES